MPRRNEVPGRPRWGVIADDLTGATDVAAAFATRGFHAVVLIDPRARLKLRADIVLLTTNSRHDTPWVARRNVRLACRWLSARRIPLIYKKIDSTVQGNIVAEVEALRDTAGFACAVVCPANPIQGRTVRRGVLRVRGRVLGRLERIFAAQGLDRSASVQTPVSFKKVVALVQAGARFVIADGATESELTNLARTGLDSPIPVLLAGSAGIAESMAKVLAAREARTPRLTSRQAGGRSQTTHSPTLRSKASLVLVLAGSQNPVTQRQLDALQRETNFQTLSVDDLARGLVEVLSRRRASCLVVKVPIHQRSEAVITRKLRRLVTLFRRGRVTAVLLTGGDTALLACRWLRVRGVAIQGEIAPGLAWGRVVGGVADGLRICTKPGGFGNERSLMTAVDFLAEVPFSEANARGEPSMSTPRGSHRQIAR